MPENLTDTNLQKKSSVLITGGSGLIGKYLTSALLAEGYKVSHLSRKAGQFGKVRVYRWDPDKKILDPLVFEGVNYIIHLAGANIGEKRWTRKRKEEIINSRVNSTNFLHDIIADNGIQLRGFISASATGYYGSVPSDKIFYENDPPGTDFLGTTCRLWEESADLFQKDGIRTVKIRTAVCLEKNDAALAKLIYPVKYGILISVGSGRQFMPWIHIKDLCNIYMKAIEDEALIGVYNAVSPQHVTHIQFIKTLAEILKPKVILPPVPAFILRAAIGEMSCVVLEGNRVSSEKIINSGYKFLFPDLADALKNIICC